MNLRWSENQLEVHLNKHELRKECASVQFKNKIEAKVHEDLIRGDWSDWNG